MEIAEMRSDQQYAVDNGTQREWPTEPIHATKSHYRCRIQITKGIMSFNAGQFGKSEPQSAGSGLGAGISGFMLPSLSSAKPTVGITAPVTTTTASVSSESPVLPSDAAEVAMESILQKEKEEQNHQDEKTDGTEQPSQSSPVPSSSLNVESNICDSVREDDMPFTEQQGDKGEPEQKQETRETALEPSPVALKESPSVTSSISDRSGSGPTLAALLAARERHTQTMQAEVKLSQRGNKFGKGTILNESSDSESEPEVVEEKKKQDVTNKQKSTFQNSVTEDKGSSDEEVSISEEKAMLEQSYADETPYNQNETASADKEDEKLINETLESSVPAGEESDALDTPDIASEKRSQDLEIALEVENEVKKIQTTESVSKNITEVKPDNEIERVKPRGNSIKDIPNPPSNLRKQQAFDFQKFLVQFKSKDCEHVHKYLKSFLLQFGHRVWSVEEQIKLVKEFQEFLFQKLVQNKPFSDIKDDEGEMNNCKEGLEKLIMTKVYGNVFSPAMSFMKLTESHKKDKVMDRRYLQNSHLYDWIELKHLDLDMKVKVDSKFIQLASDELCKMDNFKSPRDKIVCILNSSKLIFGLIRQQEQTSESADSFVPLLIYVLLHSRVHNLYSNLQYIERFRNDEFLIGETSYYVSTMQIACNFIIDMSRDQLSIDQDEFEMKMATAKEKYAERTTDSEGISASAPSEVLAKSAEMVKQSLSASLNTIVERFSGEDGSQTNAAESPDVERTSRSQLRAVMEASVASAQHESEQRTQERAVVEALCAMFPTVDTAIVTDVAAASGYVEDACVDALLELAV